MATLDALTKQKLEYLLSMSDGYVLDFSNSSFAEFVHTSVGFDPYDKYPNSGSKAKTLRTIWDNEPKSIVAKLLLDMLSYRQFAITAGRIETSNGDSTLCDDVRKTLSTIQDENPSSSLVDKFLSENLSDIDLGLLPQEITIKDVIGQRLAEIEKCINAEAPLAVIFLAGSTLEGILLELAETHKEQFEHTSCAPHRRNSDVPLPIDQWSLNNLISSASELGILGKDIQAFAGSIRNFRNYIHPERQKEENFFPRMETAKIAKQVLLAAIKDITALNERNPR